ncbi:MAG TPA: DoxX family protein [Xanthobacteraceae bacterium]|jgi:putative oxidoreductase|nr:DoxX family protein [Xanthobacteraceae bacterium]
MTALPFDFVLDARSAVRIVCGAFFLPHTIAKLRNIDRASVLFDKVGFRPPRPFVVLTTVMELIAAFGLISGLYPRLAAVVAATVLFGAAYAIARNHALMWRWQHPGIEYMVFWAVVCLLVGFLP